MPTLNDTQFRQHINVVRTGPTYSVREGERDVISGIWRRRVAEELAGHRRERAVTQRIEPHNSPTHEQIFRPTGAYFAHEIKEYKG